MPERLEQPLQTQPQPQAAASATTTGVPGQAASTSAVAPSISLPKGGGAIRGIGEKFGANPVTGTSSFSIPLATSAGRSKFGPDLSLQYDSGAGNGPFGFGWRLSTPAITRKTDKGLPQYLDAEDSDVFILTDAEDLVPALVNRNGCWEVDRIERRVDGRCYEVVRYRPRVEGPFSRIERWRDTTSEDIHWRSISRGNITTFYGRTAESRIADPRDPHRVFTWLICQTSDDRGNVVAYEYKAEDDEQIDRWATSEQNRTSVDRAANRYLKRIKYGNRSPYRPGADLRSEEWLFEVVFDYGEHDGDTPVSAESHAWRARRDPFSSYRAGFEVRTYRLCRRVLMFHHFPNEPGVGRDCLVTSTTFNYREDPIASFIATVMRASHRRADAGYVSRAMPPIELEYSVPVVHDDIKTIDRASLANLPAGLDTASYRWVDLDGEGLSGILSEQAGAWFYKRNRGGGRFADVEVVRRQPSLAAAGPRVQQQLMDLAGDGQLDLVLLSGSSSGFYERTNRSWNTFKPFAAAPLVRWDDPNLRFVDLDGDGHADVLITEGDVITWHRSLAEDGFSEARRIEVPIDEDRGPRAVFADREASIFLADMSGDGLFDLVRIRNGEVCYWPNLGYGRFGSKITMSRSPWLDAPNLFDPRRIRLADIDGSGTTDLIYLGSAGVSLYFNQCGNAWSAATRLEQFPPTDSVASISVVDLLGNGTACLVWSSPLPGDASAPVRYIDLMGGEKPHLLTRIVNNLGADTRLHYAPSTKFYVADRESGRPWVTRLPFPVHVVERVEIFDAIGRNRFVTRFAYHHGFYDGIEREFRGFGRVDQWDTEELGALTATGTLPRGHNIDASSHVPPVLTKTWFHTGAYAAGPAQSRAFAHEYYRGEGLTPAEDSAYLLDDTILPDGLTDTEAREAARALKGSVLRQEVYGLDGSDAAHRPYRVSERSHLPKLLQPLGPNRYAAFFTHGRQALDLHYERKVYRIDGHPRTDPRIQHEMTLEVDNFGNVLASASIAYGRRYADPDPALADDDRLKQQRAIIIFTQFGYTRPIVEDDAYRSPAPFETRTYELVDHDLVRSLTGTSAIVGIDDLAARSRAAAHHDLPFGDYRGLLAPAGAPARRLTEHTLTIYRRDDLSGPLPAGELESRALQFETYKKAFTPDLVETIYGGRADAAVLAAGGYVHLDGDANWWVPSGRVFYSADPNATAEEERAFAAAHFFQSVRFRDPFHTADAPTETVVTYDPYDLLVEETRDPLGNRTTAGERHTDPSRPLVVRGLDYRVLSATLVMDPNRSRSAVAFDAFGLVVGTAIMGAPETSPAPGDTLDGFIPDLPESVLASYFENPLSDPHALIQGATTRLVYDIGAYYRTKHLAEPRPAVVGTLARETHRSDERPGEPSRIQHTFSYSDGFGREVQKKAQAEPNDASPRWVGSGWTVFNNKEKPVRRYEPFFSATHRFEFNVRVGVSAVMCYDAAQRVVATVYPNHTFEKTVFDPWRQETWDVTDTALIANPGADDDVGGIVSRIPQDDYLPTWYAQRADGGLGPHEQAAARKAAVHAGTPSIAYFDPLGRAVVNVARRRYVRPGDAAGGAPAEQIHVTRVVLDSTGNQRELVDATARVVMRGDYDLLGDRVHHARLDAGERWILNDVAGKSAYVWTARGHRLRSVLDQLRRPREIYLSEADGPEALIERTVYGETVPDAERRNLRTRVLEVSDESGRATNTLFDFKGNLLRLQLRIAESYHTTIDWSGDVPLQPRIYETRKAFDALNRAIEVETADGSIMRPAFDEAGLLDRVDVNLRGARDADAQGGGERTWTPFVTNIDYDAKAQRTRIVYGNGAVTTFEYDPLTFRMTGLLTLRGAGERLQDLRYTHDPVGNITHIEDAAQQAIFFRNRRVDPSADYTYDSLYQLIEATGREHLGQVGGRSRPHVFSERAPIDLRFSDGDGQAVSRYREWFDYDGPGNLLSVSHRSDATGDGWTRTYSYDSPSPLEPGKISSRLTSTTIDEDHHERYEYDVHGNTVRMPHLQSLEWDFRDLLRTTSRQAGDAEHRERTCYVYDSAGRRARKVTEGANGQVTHERLYLEGLEIERVHGSDPVVRETLHVMDDHKRIALVETRTEGGASDAPSQLTRFQLANHLGSATLELDDRAQIVSYEEHTPFGSTALRTVRGDVEAPKRYSYTGKERDEESGFYDYGARYYAPWLGRWVSCDPAPLSGKEWPRADQSYVYVENRPIIAVDPDGRIIWFIVIAAVAITTVTVVSPANAPERADSPTYPSISNTEFAFHAGVNALSLCGGAGVAKWAFSRTGSIVWASTASGGFSGFIASPGNQFVTDVANNSFHSPGDYALITAEGTAFGGATGFGFGVVAKGWSSLFKPTTPNFTVPGRVPSGSAAETTALDAAGERLDQIIRTGAFPQETRGVGAAIVDVPGYTGPTELRAFSAAATDAIGDGAQICHATTPAKADRIFFTPPSWRGAPGGGINHVNDVEPQLFTRIAKGMPPNAQGTIHFSTLRTRAGGTVLEPLPACISCQNVAFQFSAMFPDVMLVSHAAVNPGATLMFNMAGSVSLNPAFTPLAPYLSAFFGMGFGATTTDQPQQP